MTNLDLDVTVLPEEKRIRGTAHLQLVLELESSVGPGLMLAAKDSPQRFVSVLGPKGATTKIETSAANQEMHVARVVLPRPADRGDIVRLTVEWESTGSSTGQFAVEERGAMGSWVTGWYPLPAFDINVPTSFASLLAAPGTTIFRLPLGWSSVSNGQLTHTETDADKTIETWTLDLPVARSFTAGRYSRAVEQVGERTIGIYTLQLEADQAREQAQTMSAALAALEAVFGPYPYPNYSFVEVPDNIGSFYASSEQGFIMIEGRGFLPDQANLPLFAHEMAHGWWGNHVGTSGASTYWIGESLAQFGALVAIEALEGADAVTKFLEFSRHGYSSLQSADGYFHVVEEGGDKPLSELGDGRWDHTLSDAKGHWVYWMLRNKLGADRFYSALRVLIDQFGGAAMQIDDVRRAFQDVVPDQNLDRFFSQWLDRTGAPEITLDWWATHSDDGARGAHVELVQQQPGEAFDLEIELAIHLLDGEIVHRIVEMSSKAASFELDTGEGRVVRIELDPNRRLLIWRPQYGPRPWIGDQG